MFLFNKKIVACAMILMTTLIFVTINIAPYAKGFSEPQEKILATKFLKNVIGIDLEAYQISYASSKLVLTSESSRIEVLVQFVDDALIWCNLRVLEGRPILKAQYQYADKLNAVKGSLERYQTYFNVSYCSKLTLLLDKIATLDKDRLVKTENVTLDIKCEENYVSFTWNYRLNGIEASMRKVSFSFGKNYIGFVDTWHIARIGSTDLRVSEEEAKNVARGIAEKYIKDNDMGAKIVEIKTTLDFYNSEGTGRGDRFILYPRWSVMLYFDKTYAGCFGYYVAIWADTGDVFHSDPQGFYSPIEPQEPLLDVQIWIAMMLVPATLAIATIIYRKRSPRYMKTKR